MLCPTRLVAFDRIDQRPAALRTHVEHHALHSVVHEHYEVWQQQTERLTAILDSELGDDPIDLIVDEASHLFEPTRASFECLFPRLRPGGWYVIEDWAWAHWSGPYEKEPWLERTPLSQLVFELAMVTASYRDLVTAMRIEHGFVAVQRGDRRLGPGFRLDDAYRARGKRLAWV